MRSYLPDDHPSKGEEIGAEPSPGPYIDTLLDVAEVCDRVLAPHGSLVVELGDTYSGSGGAGGDYNAEGLREGQAKFAGSGRRDKTEWPLPKSLCMIPEAFRMSLVYGRNPITGRVTEPWRVRNVVRWCRPNPPVGALADKFRPATSDMVVACKARDRWFDLDAVRNDNPRVGETYGRSLNKGNAGFHTADKIDAEQNENGSPPLDWWEITTEPFKGSHYATWPERLLMRPIEAMCPREVCTVCGEPRRRMVDSTEWTICECGGRFRRGVVLDPFAGSGTTLAVAFGYGRDAIGIDIDARNADLARERVGMWLEVKEHAARSTETAHGSRPDQNGGKGRDTWGRNPTREVVDVPLDFKRPEPA